MTAFPWTCPFCGRDTTITDDRVSVMRHKFEKGNRHGPQAVTVTAIVCPNQACREYALSVAVQDVPADPAAATPAGPRARSDWSLIPAAAVRAFPSYVPAPVLADYREACLIQAASPRSAATLARRCLQRMIRDVWGIARARLVDEIEAVQEKVDESTWAAIDAVRRAGAIGAHLAKDTSLILDVEPEEARLLIDLVETLIEDWYVATHERERRMQAIANAADLSTPARSVQADIRSEATHRAAVARVV